MWSTENQERHSGPATYPFRLPLPSTQGTSLNSNRPMPNAGLLAGSRSELTHCPPDHPAQSRLTSPNSRTIPGNKTQVSSFNPGSAIPLLMPPSSVFHNGPVHSPIMQPAVGIPPLTERAPSPLYPNAFVRPVFHGEHMPSFPSQPYTLSTDVSAAGGMVASIPPDDSTFVSQIEAQIKSRNAEPQKNQCHDSSKDLSLREGAKYVEDIQHITQQISGLRDYLIDNMRIDDADWKKAVEKIRNLKVKLEEKMAVLMQPSVADILKQRILERKKKRERLRRKKSLSKSERIATLMERVRRHREIDEWQHKLMLKDKAKRLVDSLKSEAGETLSEVRKKKNEIDKLGATLLSVKELRNIRRQTSLARGVFVFEEDDEAFEDRIQKLLSLIDKRKKIYEEEENALLVMMKEEREEFTRIEEEKRKQRLKEEEEREWNNPLLPFLRYWMQAEDSIESLVNIRTAWDIYIAPPSVLGASRIPDDWVVPPTAPSDQWKVYAQKNK